MKRPTRVALPQQERSKESLERVMQAGLEILAEGGWQEFTMARVCERAGVSVGMVYRRFHGREDLLLALQNRWIGAAASGVDALRAETTDWTTLDARAALRHCIVAFINVLRLEEDRTRVLGVQSAIDGEMLAGLRESSHQYADWFRNVLLRYADEITAEDPADAIDFAFRAVFDMTIRRITHGDDYTTGRTVGDWDAFADRLTELCAAYLFLPSR
ncbi:MAG TPA: TetR/AcrR family transcriptional regulator [Pseudolysinimonas sp.]|nr:TetR/AcrR family transcriptional regulator [Pseudolysinimonas sp.]